MSKSTGKPISEQVAELQRENKVLRAANTELTSKLEKRVSAEQRLMSIQRQLKDASLAKSTYIAMAGHDLLQPMNAAKLFLSELEGIDQVDAAKPLIQSLAFSLQNMDILLDSLINISKLNNSGIEPQPESFCINELLNHLITEFSLKAESESLDFHYRACVNVWVYSDSQLLLRILRNFLTNAFRYTATGKVLLGCRRRPNGLEIQVIDNGVGISDDVKSTLFAEFVRGKGAVRGDQGLGLGLAIVDKIATLLGHNIYHYSVLGKGSLFSVLVPYGNSNEDLSHNVINQLVSDTPFVGKRVLLLGVDALENTQIERRLSQWGCVVETKTSVENLSANMKVIFDVCLVGEELYSLFNANELRKKLARSTIVIVDKSATVLKSELLAAGFCLLQRPVQPLKLRTIIQRIV